VISISSKKWNYIDYIQKPQKLGNINPAFKKVEKIGKYNANFMIIDNNIILKKYTEFNLNLGFQHKRPFNSQLNLAKWLDRIFWFRH
jgi:hypothetical protein